jgi:hypothetical protein
MTVNQNKEVIGISSAVGFPISIKPIGLDQAEIESDVRMVKMGLLCGMASRVSSNFIAVLSNRYNNYNQMTRGE